MSPTLLVSEGDCREPQPRLSEEAALENGVPTEFRESHSVRAPGIERYVQLAVWMVVAVTLIFIALRIIGSGFLPGGDARRHVAKAFTDKAYTDLVVMRPEYTMDHSPGWEWLLRQVHRTLHWDSDALMSFSIFLSMACVFFAPFPWLKRPEAWLAALLAQMVVLPDLIVRFAQARPFLLTEAVLIAILFAWSGPDQERPSRRKAGLTCLGIALSVWMHGAWYLWVLPVAAFILAGRWRTALRLGICLSVGTLAGALLTGKPVEFLRQAVLIAMAISREHIPQWMLVGEFTPGDGYFATLFLIAAVWLWRRQKTGAEQNLMKDPTFCLIVISWILGFKADRFWADWGIPAVLVWLTLQFQQIITETWTGTSWRRCLAGGFLAVPLFLHTTNDLGRRYSSSLNDVFLDGNQPALQSWMPGTNGVFYTANMQFFYNTFYKNPHGEWRYVLGMEPALMTDTDLRIYRRIQLSNYSIAAFEPWVERMHPADRLELACTSMPDLPNLEWTNAAANIWIGRIPRAL
ncbi:MAG TPA: hypothetical protein VHI52_10315 [Verrucomicrobiae bacterium]|nr:hypothetical protein [Verrucomicrobiae bacterium]